MTIPWPGEKCIVCIERAANSLEHVIPKSLGGILSCQFLCTDCNSFFGGMTDATVKCDPMIRNTALAIQHSVPALVAKIEEGQRYLIHTEAATLQAQKKFGEICGTWHAMLDGSSIAPEDQAITSLRGRLKAEGLSVAEVDDTIARYEAAEPGELVNMSPTYSAKKLAAYLAGPDFRAAPEANAILFVKIAYEFTALLVGQAIYARSPQLNEIRDVLKNLRRESAAFRVERLMAEEPRAFHGIAFEGNAPYAIFQIRLFGRPAYRVHLHRILVQHKPIAYTHDLETGKHWHNLDDAEEAA